MASTCSSTTPASRSRGPSDQLSSAHFDKVIAVNLRGSFLCAREAIKQESPFCPNIAATPDGEQVWFTLKDIGKTQVFNAKPPFNPIRTIETGPITNHVNFARTREGNVRLCHDRRHQRGQGVSHR